MNKDSLKEIIDSADKHGCIVIGSAESTYVYGASHEILAILAGIVKNLATTGTTKEEIQKAIDMGFMDENQLLDELKNTINQVMEKIEEINK